MANMSYCRFENTYNDLLDCLENIEFEAENERDERYRVRMIRLLHENIDFIEDLKQELDNPGMFIDDKEWEKEMGRQLPIQILVRIFRYNKNKGYGKRFDRSNANGYSASG